MNWLHGVPVTTRLVAVVLALTSVSTALMAINPAISPSAQGLDSAVERVSVQGDSDGDGLPDAVENIAGSNPSNPFTLGSGVPDGWLHHVMGNAIDWSRPEILASPVLVPPRDAVIGTGAEHLAPPTLAALYEKEERRALAAGLSGAWWLQLHPVDPLEWDNDLDDVADAWLIQHDLAVFSIDVDQPTASDASFTYREKYLLSLDPSAADSDRDGLLDREEISGWSPLWGGRTFEPTNPTRYSTLGSGVADGYLVRFGLDPHDARVLASTPANDGVSVTQAYQATALYCGALEDCHLGDLMRSGTVIDPTHWDSLGDGVPDAWSLQHATNGSSIHPLVDSRDHILSSTTAWDSLAWTGDSGNLRGLLVDDLNPRPAEPFEVTALAAYQHGRPQHWNESLDGPYWGGLHPTTDNLTRGLPAAVALRGWIIQVDAGLGPAEDVRTIPAQANPGRLDSDGDGISDVHEYFGLRPDGSRGNRTHPLDADTDGDGLADALEYVHGTSPVERDTAGNFLMDGENLAYWSARFNASVEAFRNDPQSFAWLEQNGTVDLTRLLPSGNLGSGTPNLLSPDADGDGIRDGAELYPLTFHDPGGGRPRLPIDPARRDTDADGLPDAWELQWTEESAYQCGRPCRSPVAVSGWPIDPALQKSVPVEGAADDSEINLSGDILAGQGVQFSNGMAHKYDLHPFVQDTTPSDGIRDLFAVHWGVENVPAFVQDLIQNNPKFAWAIEASEDLGTQLVARGFEAPTSPVVMHPSRPGNEVDTSSNLLSMFTGRAKGIWVHDASTACVPSALPSSGNRAEDAPRAGLVACWKWVDYLVGDDMESSTNPWLHDTDVDGLPDAWERHYESMDALASSFTQSSQSTGCMESQSLGSGGPHCLRFIDEYRHGTNPLVSDSDGGGMPDWFEIHSTPPRNPLDSRDDASDLDWDGDGVANADEIRQRTDPLRPDTDGDGLADGGQLRPDAPAAHGNLCIRASSEIAPFTKDRPGGELTYLQVHDEFARAGVARVVNANACPPGHSLFLSEGINDPGLGRFVGAGADASGTRRADPTNPDTSGDGVPDGWSAYWRQRSNQDDAKSMLQPTTDLRDLDILAIDRDGIATVDEYFVAMPRGWTFARDGVWWGGTSPIKSDTDNDSGSWYAGFGADDDADHDLDGDGLVETDINPFSPDGGQPGILHRNASGIHLDYTRLFDWLADPPAHQFHDPDADQVPTFLDRAEVVVAATFTGPTPGLVAKHSEFHVVGNVTTLNQATKAVTYWVPSESQVNAYPATAARVAGATVVAWLSDGNQWHPIGINVTDSDGNFSITAGVGDAAISATAPFQMTALQQLLAVGDSLEAPHDAANFRAGTYQILVGVEANDPSIQPLQFVTDTATHSHVQHRKSVASTGYTVPNEDHAVRGVTFDESRQVRTSSGVYAHATEAIFSAKSQQFSLTIQETASPTLDALGSALIGDFVNATGRLVTEEGAPVRDWPIIVASTADPSMEWITHTDDSGEFWTLMNTSGWHAGLHQVTARLGGADPPFTGASSVTSTLHLRENLRWTQVRIGDIDVAEGQVVRLRAGTAHPLDASIENHLGSNRPSAGTWTLSTLDGSYKITDDTQPTLMGMEGPLQIPEGVPLEDLVFKLSADDVAIEPHSLLVRPLVDAAISVSPVSILAGDRPILNGTLSRLSGTPIHDDSVALMARSSEGHVTSTGTDADGAFAIRLPPANAGNASWTVQVLGSKHILAGTHAQTWVTATTDAVVELENVTALPGERIVVQGTALNAVGQPILGSVELTWREDGSEAGRASLLANGEFEATITAPLRVGHHELLARFAGTEYVSGALASTNVTVRTISIATIPDATVGYDATGTLVSTSPQGILVDADGNGIANATATLMTRCGSKTWAGRATTDADGRFNLLVGDILTVPGPCTLKADFGDGPLWTGASATGTLTVMHEAKLQVIHAPAGAASGSLIHITGAIQTAAAEDARVPLRLVADGRTVARGDFSSMQGWSFVVPWPESATGSVKFEIRLSDDDRRWESESINWTMTDRSGVAFEISEDVRDGRRLVQVLAMDEGRPVAGLRIHVGKVNMNGTYLPVGSATTDAAGKAEFSSASQVHGEWTVHLDARRGHYVAEVDAITTSAASSATSPNHSAWWAAAVVAGIAAAVVGSVAARTVLNRRRQLRSQLAEARRFILDPSVPAATTIGDIYQRFLEMVSQTQQRPRESWTAREVAGAAAKRLGVASHSLQTLTELYEQVEYAGRSPKGGRRTAMQALREIDEALGARTIFQWRRT